MDFVTLKAQIISGLNRGDTLDSVVDDELRAAIRWVESEQPVMSYLFQTAEFVQAISDRDIALPVRLNSLAFLRIILDSAEYSYLTKIEPMEQAQVLTQRPKSFWYELGTVLKLGQVPDAAYNMEWGYFQATDEESIADDDTHFLITNASQLLKYTTTLNMAYHVRMENRQFDQLTTMQGRGMNALLTLLSGLDSSPLDEQMGVPA